MNFGFVVTYKGGGKKHRKGYPPNKIVVKNIIFIKDKKQIFRPGTENGDKFINELGLDNPETIDAVINSMYHNFGLHIRKFNIDEESKLEPEKEKEEEPKKKIDLLRILRRA